MAAISLSGADDKEYVMDVIFNTYCSNKIQGLSPAELQRLYETIRPDGLSYRQIEASVSAVCETSTCCDKEDLIDVLQEMDRRYFLVNDLKWEFAMLDRKMKGSINEDDAKFLFKMVHGEFFSLRRWNKLLASRVATGSQISFAEIEVDLCDIPTMGWIEEVIEEEEEERRGKLATYFCSLDMILIRKQFLRGKGGKLNSPLYFLGEKSLFKISISV